MLRTDREAKLFPPGGSEPGWLYRSPPSLLKSKIPTPVCFLVLPVAQMLSNSFYELFLPEALGDKLVLWEGATTGEL